MLDGELKPCRYLIGEMSCVEFFKIGHITLAVPPDAHCITITMPNPTDRNGAGDPPARTLEESANAVFKGGQRRRCRVPRYRRLRGGHRSSRVRATRGTRADQARLGRLT